MDVSGHGVIGRRAGLYGGLEFGPRYIPGWSQIGVRVQVPLAGPNQIRVTPP
jgi:hypothetical protein